MTGTLPTVTPAPLQLVEDAARADVVTLRLSGDFVGAVVDEVASRCEAAHAVGSRVVLDITDLRTLDVTGAALAQDVAARGGLVVNGSAQVSRMLLAQLRRVRQSPSHD